MIAVFAAFLVPVIGPADRAWCGADPVEATDVPEVVPTAICDLQGVTIRDQGVGVEVPPPGTGVQSIALMSDGRSEALFVQTASDGTVTLSAVGSDRDAVGAALEMTGRRPNGEDEDPPDPSSGTVTGDECTDGYYGSFMHGGEHDVHEWYMNSGSIPSYFDNQSEVIARIREGGAHITHGTTDCNISLEPDLGLAYQGTTSSGVDITDQLTCMANSDGKNVVGFGNLPPSVTAVTCNWVSTYFSELEESDIRFNNDPDERKFFATDSAPVPCDGSIDLEGTATHERGHTFGLSDISPADHPNLTMRGNSLSDCSTEKRTLGKGDIVGLNALY